MELLSIDKLIPYERNPRKISQKAIDAVAKSIRMNGARDPIEIDEKGVILDRMQTAFPSIEIVKL